MKNIIYILLFFVSVVNGQTTHVFDNFAGATTEVKWGNMYNAVKATTGNDIVQFTSGQIYDLTNMVHLHEVNGITLTTTGTGKATLRSSITNVISRADGTPHGANNVLHNNIKFETTAVQSGIEGSANSLVFYGYSSGANIDFTNCEFTAPNAMTNAIKILANATGEYSGIDIDNVYIHDMGRMGIETVNHYFPLTTNRIHDVTITNSTIDNVGLVTNSSGNVYGMAISFSGRNTDMLIENTSFNNAPNTAVEMIGGLRNTVNNNTMSGVGDPIHAVRLNASEGNGTTIPNEDVLLTNNVSTMTGAISLINVDGLVSRNNSWYGSRNMYFEGVRNILFEDDTISIFGENPNFNGGTATAFVQIFPVQGTSYTENAQNGLIEFNNSVLRLRNNVSFFAYVSNSTPTVNVNCVNVYHPNSSGSFNPNGTVADASIYINEVFSSETGNTGNDCGSIGYVDGGTITPPVITINKEPFYNAFFNN